MNTGVLIESDWNLKKYYIYNYIDKKYVLIESDWNLKDGAGGFLSEWTDGINRIRLEFKDA